MELFFIGLIILVLGITLRISDEAPLLDIIVSGIGAIFIYAYIVSSGGTPTAMDVYRGKTTLEITYKDSVAVDSIVVFKK